MTSSSDSTAVIAGTAIVATVAFASFVAVFIDASNFRPDGRVFPRLVSVVGAVSAATIFATACGAVRRARPAVSLAGDVNQLGWTDYAVGYGGPAFYGLMLYLSGFWIASTFCLTSLLMFLGERRPAVLVTITAGTLLSIYLIFTFAFSIRMPSGLLLEWWQS